MRSALVRMFLLLLVGCTPAAPPMTPAPPLPEPPASATTPPPPPPAPAPDPFAVPEDLKSEPIAVAIPDEAPPPLPTVRKDVRGPDRSCNAWAKRRKGKAPACKERSEALTALERALGEGDTEKRDVALAGLEECTGLPAGLIRALRAELAPTECADVLAEPALSKSPKGISNAVLQVLAGHVLAGRLARLGGDMPTMKPPYEKEKILEHVKGPLAKWLIVQTSAIEEASQTGAKLQGYARALVAVEAGIADMRLVDSIRTVPVPQEWDEELKGVYQSALEEAMEPRKQRGRDAALLGLGGMGALGVIEDLRLARVRAFLTKLYQGRRIDALDGLLLPAAGSEGKTVEQRLAARLPTFYATQLLDAGAMTEADALRAWLKRGLPVALRAALKGGALTPEQRKLVVQARMALGQRYWRRFDFDEMIALVGKEKERSEEETLLLATALALRGGPENAADMMLRPPSMSLGVLDVAALDQVARSSSRLAPMAAYNAAYLLALSPPENANEAFWRGVQRRFQEVAGRLQDGKHQALAEQKARQAGEIADALQSTP